MATMKDSDNWQTPKWFMRLVGNLTDRTPMNHAIDCLATEWETDSYINPPYSDPLPFVLKGIAEHQKKNIIVVFLLKLDPSTKWFKVLAEGGAHFLFFSERLHYSDKGSAPFPSVLAILSD